MKVYTLLVTKTFDVEEDFGGFQTHYESSIELVTTNFREATMLGEEIAKTPGLSYSVEEWNVYED